jgi:hypothetical protein
MTEQEYRELEALAPEMPSSAGKGRAELQIAPGV